MDDPIMLEVARVIAERMGYDTDQVLADIEHLGGPDWLASFIFPAIDAVEQTLYPRLLPVA